MRPVLWIVQWPHTRRAPRALLLPQCAVLVGMQNWFVVRSETLAVVGIGLYWKSFGVVERFETRSAAAAAAGALKRG